MHITRQLNQMISPEGLVVEPSRKIFIHYEPNNYVTVLSLPTKHNFEFYKFK